MTLKRYLQIDYLPIPLITIMVLTRFHHFGDVLHLPDASLAVFFFAGFYRKKMLLGFLLALAAIIDYAAIANGTNSWCISPAYVFLIPTYSVMWFAGRYSARLATTNSSKLTLSVKAISLLTLAITIAFVISNCSFYLFSGRYTHMILTDYVTRIAHYYVPYLSSTLMYSLIGYALVQIIKLVITTQDSRKTI